MTTPLPASGPRTQSNRGLRILPSATTVLAICAGLTSIKFALDGRPHVALALIGAQIPIFDTNAWVGYVATAAVGAPALLSNMIMLSASATAQSWSSMPRPSGANQFISMKLPPVLRLPCR